MAPCSQINGLLFAILSPYVAASECIGAECQAECGDFACAVNVQLLQQDMNLQSYSSSNQSAGDEELASLFENEEPAEELNMSDYDLAEQATVALSQFSKMISDDRAQGEIRLADRMGGKKKMPFPTAHTKLVAYRDRGTCGPMGDDYNSEWCGWYRPRFHVRKTWHCIDQVFTTACDSGIAKLVSTVGGGATDDSVSINGCTYQYYAKYECSDVIIKDLTLEDNYTYLKELEKNLTDWVHQQAIVISKATDSYLRWQAVDETSDLASDNLDDDLDDAQRQEAITGNAEGSLNFLIARKKRQLDAIEKATEEANETLQLVKPEYERADLAYKAALGPGPYVEQNAEDAQAEYEEAQAALDAAESTQRAADLAVENQTMKLQKEVAKLNDKNDELRKVQEELDRPLPPAL